MEPISEELKQRIKDREEKQVRPAIIGLPETFEQPPAIVGLPKEK